MREANRKSIYCDGVENVTDGSLVYSDELIAKVNKVFNVVLPKIIKFEDIEMIAEFIVNQIIKTQITPPRMDRK